MDLNTREIIRTHYRCMLSGNHIWCVAKYGIPLFSALFFSSWMLFLLLFSRQVAFVVVFFSLFGRNTVWGIRNEIFCLHAFQSNPNFLIDGHFLASYVRQEKLIYKIPTDMMHLISQFHYKSHKLLKFWTKCFAYISGSF